MFRVVLYLILAILIISLLRSVIGIIGKAISATLDPSPDQKAAGGSEQAGGELKRDPICGTFVSAAASIKRNVGKDVVHFCSESCREKYEKATSRG